MTEEWWQKPRWDESDWGDPHNQRPDSSGEEAPKFTYQQLAEAQAMAAALGISLQEALIRLGLISDSDRLERMGFIANGGLHESKVGSSCEFVELPSNLIIPLNVVELITESMARENTVIAIACIGDSVDIAMETANPVLLDKLRFVLNRDIVPKIALRQSILAAMDRHYGAAS